MHDERPVGQTKGISDQFVYFVSYCTRYYYIYWYFVKTVETWNIYNKFSANLSRQPLEICPQSRENIT